MSFRRSHGSVAATWTEAMHLAGTWAWQLNRRHPHLARMDVEGRTQRRARVRDVVTTPAAA